MRQLAFPLSPHGQALWHWLMWRANTVYWQFPLRLSVPEIAGRKRMLARRSAMEHMHNFSPRLTAAPVDTLAAMENGEVVRYDA